MVSALKLCLLLTTVISLNGQITYRPVVELGIFIDAILWQRAEKYFGSEAESALRKYTSAVIGYTQKLYHHPSMKPQVDLKIVHFKVFKTQPQELCDRCVGRHTDDTTEVSWDKLLGSFQNASWQTEGQWDASVLITGFSVDGIANVRAICDPKSRSLVAGVNSSPGDIAHELGHLLDMNHDYEDVFANASSKQAKRGYNWSAKRIYSFNKLLNEMDLIDTNCMRQSPLPSVMDVAENPNSVFTPDMHCKLLGGRKSNNDLNPNACFQSCASNPVKGNQLMFYGAQCGPKKFCTTTLDFSENSPSNCVANPGVHEGFRLYDHFGAQNVADQSACKALCQSNADCKGSSFDNSHQYSFGNCFLFLHTDDMRPDSAWVSWKKGSSDIDELTTVIKGDVLVALLSLDMYTTLDKFNFGYGNCPGNDIGDTTRGLNEYSCAVKCDKLPDCKTFIFKLTDNTCNLKRQCNLDKLVSIGDRNFELFVKTYSLPATEDLDGFKIGVRLYGHYSAENVANTNECKRRCQQSNECLGVSFDTTHAYSFGNCFLCNKLVKKYDGDWRSWIKQ